MSRAEITYADARSSAPAARGVDVETPVAGFYQGKLRSGGVIVGIRLWYGPPCDRDTGEVLDRHWRWQAEANGSYLEFDEVWPGCAGKPITQAEYRRFCAQQAWAREHAPDSAYATPTIKIDLLSRSHPLPF